MVWEKGGGNPDGADVVVAVEEALNGEDVKVGGG